MRTKSSVSGHGGAPACTIAPTLCRLTMRDVFHIHGWPRALAGSCALACGALLMALAATHEEAHAGVVPEGSCSPPYQASSPWNTPIVVGPAYEPNTAARVNAIGGSLSSDPTQFTYPVYYATASTPTRQVQLSGWFSRANADGTTFTNHESATVQVPVPPAAAPASGSDAQVIIIDRSTGKEWGFFNFSTGAGNTFTAANGYGYTVNGSATPVHAHGNGFVARGAGVPYLAGLVRKCEIQAGSIDHALAFAYDAPGPDFVFPATKSDGAGTGPLALPEGARLQLDPALTTAQINAWGCSGACLTIARALQIYGMYVVDNAGRPKMMMEFEGTANWNGLVTAQTASPIPLSAFKVLDLDSGAGAPPPTGAIPPGEPPAPPPSQANPKKKEKKVKSSAKGTKRLVVVAYRVRGRHLRADQRFEASLALRPGPGMKRIPKRVRLRCPARIGSKAVPVAPAQLRRVGKKRRLSAVCRWSIPAGVRGKKLRASVRVIYAGGETKIRFVGKIRRAV